jgi:hypothetical protein
MGKLSKFKIDQSTRAKPQNVFKVWYSKRFGDGKLRMSIFCSMHRHELISDENFIYVGSNDHKGKCEACRDS